MPLVRFEVKNEYGLGDPELYRGASKRDDPKALLDGTAVAGLVGILRQLGDLAEFAADIFHDLHEHVMATAARGHKMLSRIQHIEEALPSLENAIQCQTSHIHFAYVAGTDWHANLGTEKSLLLSSDLPRFMLDSYEECRDPPRLYLLDKFDSGGTGACLKRYSDPSYFKRVWTTSELAKAEMVQREKKAQINKRKGSRLRNGENQNAGYMSRRNSSTRFASPRSEVQSFSTENISISDLRLKSELASGSTSFGSKTRLSFVEQVSDTNPSVVPDEEEYDKLSVTKLQIDHSDSCASALHDEPNGDVADDDSHHDSLQGSVPRSPSVTWDEKTEIVKSTSSKSCEDILVDRVLESELLPSTSESPNMDTETSKHGSLDREDILFDNSNPSLSLSAGNHFDEVTSEADNYMDALNTLESETETDSECQTKREVKLLSNLEDQGMESTTRQMHGMTAVNFDSSDIVTPMKLRCPLNNDVSPISYNLGSSESSEMVHSPFTTGFVPAGNGFSENVADTSRTNDFEGSPELSIPDSQTMSVDETTSNTSKSLDFPFDTSSMPSTQLWTNGGLFGVQPSKPLDFTFPNIANESIVSGSKNTGCDRSSENVTTKLLYGASSAKSKTVVNPNETISNNSSIVKNINGSPNTLSSADQSSLNSEQLFGLICNVAQPTDPSKCFPSCHDYKCNDMPVKHNSQESVEALSLDQLEKTQGMPSDIIYAHTTRVDQKKTNIAPGTEFPCQIESKSNESAQNTKAISSSFSGLAQRFLANGLQRNALITHADISTPSGVMNADIRTSEETSVQNKHKKSGTSDGQNTKEQIDQGSFRKPVSFSSRYSESSSPPLEHMKISFHPMNVLETSKLKLEFPNGNLHENIEDMMFPSFKLLPGPLLPLPDSGSESDDDTFCRSCPYSSEDILSPRSYSNSEQWEKDERSGSKENEIYNDSCRISSSSTSNCSCIGFELRNHCNIDSASGFENFETKDGTITFQSGSVVDLPGFDTFISSKSQWEEQCVSSSSDHANSALQSPNELPPPPPPLPPIQWRVMKSSFTSTEEEDSRNAEIVDHLDDLQAQIFNVALQQEQAIPKPPCISGNLASNSIKHTQDQQKLNGNREPNHDVNSKKMDEREELLHQIQSMHDQKKLNGLQHDQKKLNGHKEPKKFVNIEVDEREELLHQIRNKAFNLRRTAAAKPSMTPQPTTNVNVAAILEKANAIRQAFVGSDEGGDDGDGDNWSDN